MTRVGTPKDRSERRGADHIWALRDVSFDVREGEVLGIIGRNGAGKSTLLKILSRITQPTRGQVEVYGRIGSLLEVGTGFHPELTGRENVFLSGSILGMRRQEVQRKFDEIVAFADVEDFLDTPVKHYSSGMHVRLAFAVAAHLEPEILLIDEVLAVGDLAFQKKCLGRIGEVARGGRTVLFVSHNMAAIEALCQRCLLLWDGALLTSGEPADVVRKYLAHEMACATGPVSLVSHPGRHPSSRPLMTEVNAYGHEEAGVRMGKKLRISVKFKSEPPIRPVLGVVVRTSMGAPLFGVNNKFIDGYRFEQALRAGTLTCIVDALPLMPGSYSLDLYFGDQSQDYDVIERAVTFDVFPADIYGTGKLPPSQCGPVFTSAEFVLEPGHDACLTPRESRAFAEI